MEGKHKWCILHYILRFSYIQSILGLHLSMFLQSIRKQRRKVIEMEEYIGSISVNFIPWGPNTTNMSQTGFTYLLGLSTPNKAYASVKTDNNNPICFYDSQVDNIGQVANSAFLKLILSNSLSLMILCSRKIDLGLFLFLESSISKQCFWHIFSPIYFYSF